MNRRHFQEEEFPEHCDHCPRVLGPGVAYQRVQMIVDAENSFVGGHQASVEHSFELVFCTDCASRLNHWLQNPLAAPAADGETVEELDDAELQDELEKELYILAGDSEPVVSETQVRSALEAHPHIVAANVGGHAVARASRGDCLTCSGCYGAHAPDCPSYSSAAAKPSSQLPAPEAAQTFHDDPDIAVIDGAVINANGFPLFPQRPRPCLDPDKMKGAEDQFPGSDYDEEKLL